MAATKAQIGALYVGYFNRGADPEGLNYWVSQTQMSLVEIANSFAVQPEATALYPFLAAPNLQSIPAIDQFITSIYQNVFERAPDAAGLVFWRNEILNGKPPGRVVVDIESGALGDDKIILDRKTEVSVYYAEQFLLAGDNPWTAANDLADAQAVLDGDRAFWLSANAVAIAKANADELIAQSFAETLDLTPGQDDLIGTSADDVFNGAVEQTAFLPIQTLNTVDSLDGEGGRNTLNAQLVDPFVVPLLLANIQVVNINQPSGLTPVLIGLLVPVTLDVVNANAIEMVNFRAPVQNITIASVTTALTDVSITDNTFPALGGRTFTISHVGPATNGGDDELGISLRNDNTYTILNLVFQPLGGYEIVNIHSAGPLQNMFELNAAPRDIIIDGDAGLLIRGTALNLATLEDFDSTDLAAPAGVDAEFFGGAGAAHETDIDTGDGADLLVVRNGSSGRLFINTNGGDDSLDIWQHTGSVDVDMADGNDDAEIDTVGNATVHMGGGNNFAEFGQITGNVVVDAGAGNDSFRFEDIIGVGAGKVTADAGDGDNEMYFHLVTGAIDAKAGAGNDFFDFDDVFPALTHTFGAGDKIDGGGGANRVRFEVESNAGNKQLITGGTIVNVQTAQHIGTFVAGTDLLVDFALLGSVDRLELQGSYGRDVNITNLNDTDGGIDTVAVQSSIADDLILERAFVTIPAFNIEMGSAGGSAVTIGDQLQAGLGTDLITITSLGAGVNNIVDASAVNGNVVVKGDTDFLLGSGGTFGEAFGTLLEDQTLDLSAATGDDTVWTGLGNQRVIDGDGNDGFGIHGNGGPLAVLDNSDVIELAGGSNIVAFFDFNLLSANGGSLAPTGTNRLHQVQNFDVSADPAANDQIWVNLGGAANSFDQTDGVAVGSFDVPNIRDYVTGDVVNLQASTFNFIKFTTAVSGDTNVDGLFDAAIGAGIINVVNGSDLMAAAYDADRGNAVFFQINNGNTQITSGDSADGVAVVGMTYDEFLAFDPTNFNFFA